MIKQFIVRLTSAERESLSELVSKGKTAAYRIKHANILLKADADGPSWTDKVIGKAFGCTLSTVANVRQRFVEGGVERVLERRAQSFPSRHPILDGEKEAKLIALSCSEPPEGRGQWTLRLLADRMITLDFVDSISHETVRTALKKTS